MRTGPASLSPAELLALILRSGSRNLNIVDTCNEIISEFRLEKLADTALGDLQKIRGIGKVKAMQIIAVFELLRLSVHFEYLMVLLHFSVLLVVLSRSLKQSGQARSSNRSRALSMTTRSVRCSEEVRSSRSLNARRKFGRQIISEEESRPQAGVIGIGRDRFPTRNLSGLGIEKCQIAEEPKIGIPHDDVLILSNDTADNQCPIHPQIDKYPRGFLIDIDLA